jgi:thymidylate synthase (FAD)
VIKEIKVLDDGFVRLVDSMGTDAAIVQAARVSYGEGTKSINDDETLINYLMRHNHTTPFEMVEFKFHIRMPMDIWRQHIRHRTASVNEYSTRYSLAIDSKAKTASDAWRAQSTSNKQGSDGTITELKDINNLFNLDTTNPGEYLSKEEALLHDLSQTVYNNRINSGVAREQARKDLLLSTYTEAYWKIDLHNLLHYLRLRIDNHAQLEIREYAKALGSLISNITPIAWNAFKTYRMNSMLLTAYDIHVISIINTLTERIIDNAIAISITNGHVPLKWSNPKCRERIECVEKLQRLGFV